MTLEEIERLRTAPEADFRFSVASGIKQILDNQADDLKWRADVVRRVRALERWKSWACGATAAMGAASAWLAARWSSR